MIWRCFTKTNPQMRRAQQKEGVEKIHPIGPMNDFEKKLYAAAIPELKKNIAKGVEFANKA